MVGKLAYALFEVHLFNRIQHSHSDDRRDTKYINQHSHSDDRRVYQIREPETVIPLIYMPAIYIIYIENSRGEQSFNPFPFQFHRRVYRKHVYLNLKI